MNRRLDSLKTKMLSDPEVRKHYQALEEEFSMVREMIRARVRAGMTQAEVAKAMGTAQSVVARLESGKRLPTLSTLVRYAEATGTKPVLKLAPKGGNRGVAKSVGPKAKRRRK